MSTSAFWSFSSAITLCFLASSSQFGDDIARKVLRKMSHLVELDEKQQTYSSETGLIYILEIEAFKTGH